MLALSRSNPKIANNQPLNPYKHIPYLSVLMAADHARPFKSTFRSKDTKASYRGIIKSTFVLNCDTYYMEVSI